MKFASQRSVARADLGVLDAQLALARTGLVSASQPTMLDTDGDGLPDLHQQPLQASRLLDQKVTISLQCFEQSKLGYARAETLRNAGRGSDGVLRAAAQFMHEAELAWLAAQMERDSNSQHGSSASSSGPR